MRIRAHIPRRRSAANGGVLLEVVIALALFVGAATVISTGMNASVRSVERQRLNTHGMDLAVTVMSELQLGLRSFEPAEPELFEAPFTNWTWQVVATPEDTLEEESPFQTVEVIVRHDRPGHVVRLYELLTTRTNDVTAFGEIP